MRQALMLLANSPRGFQMVMVTVITILQDAGQFSTEHCLLIALLELHFHL